MISGIVLLAGSRHLPREMALMLAKLRATPSRRARRTGESPDARAATHVPVPIGKSAISTLRVRQTLTKLSFARVNQTEISVGLVLFLE